MSCPKCWGDGERPVYCSDRQQSSFRNSYCPKTEHLHRICLVCGYDRAEPCADAKT